MPTRITHFLHRSTVAPVAPPTAAIAGLTVGSVHAHDLGQYLPTFQSVKGNFRGIINGIWVKVTTATGAATVTMRLCADAAGDVVLIPDTAATLVPGVTTAATQWAAYSVNLAMEQALNLPGNQTLYLFVSLDAAAGAAKFAESTITWQE
jgi:hypothetical protein